MSYLKHQNLMPEFLCNYLKYKNFIVFCPSTTVETYYNDLKSFFRFIKLYFYNKEKLDFIDKNTFKDVEIQDITIDDMANVTQDDVEKYIYFLSNVLQNDSKTRNNKISALKKLFDYLADKNFIPDNPTLNIDYAKINKRLPKYLNLEESKQMLSDSIKSNDKYKIRNYAIICLFLNCGMRLSELVGINIKDIDFSENKLNVIGKGNKERTIYLNKACINAINAYLKDRPKEGIKFNSRDALFLSEQRRRISNRTVQYVVKEEMRLAGIDSTKYSVHKLRHTAATLMYKYGQVDIRALQELLGHESISTTEIYTHVDNEQIRNAVESNPLADTQI